MHSLRGGSRNEAEDLAVKLLFAMRDGGECVERRNRDLGDQLRRAATSIASNLSEGRRAGRRQRGVGQPTAGLALIGPVGTALFGDSINPRTINA